MVPDISAEKILPDNLGSGIPEIVEFLDFYVPARSPRPSIYWCGGVSARSRCVHRPTAYGTTLPAHRLGRR
jgi:hypothetical protein